MTTKKKVFLPELQLDLEAVIDLLTDYSVIHQRLPQQGKREVYGLAHSKDRAVYVEERQEYSEKRDTIVHELYHLHLRRQGFKEWDNEKIVNALTKETFKSFYKR